jgi:hypothetical protein
MKLYRVSFLALVMLIVWCSTMSAQTALTSLSGTVSDAQGAVVPNADITLSDSDIGFSQTHKSKGRGEYVFAQIPPGKYSITVTTAAFGKATQLVELLVNQPATVNFSLTVAEQISVSVDATSEVLNTTDATIGTPIDSAEIQTLPFAGANIQDLLSLQAGVVFTGDNNENSNTDTRAGSVDGARSDQNNITLDGVDNNVSNKGYAFAGALRATRDSLEEFRVSSTQNNADAGHSSGAQVALITRAGTNVLHGSAYYYYRPTDTISTTRRPS